MTGSTGIVTDSEISCKGRKHGLAVKFLFLLLFLSVVFISFRAISDIQETALWTAQGDYVVWSGDLVADISNTSWGYFMARISYATSVKLKLRVVYGGTTLDYDLPGNAEYIVIPLQMGSGYYQAVLYENVSGKKYAAAGSVEFYAQLYREDLAFLHPNVYVNYNMLSEAVAKAAELGEGKTTQGIYDEVCHYVTSNFVYDFIKALTVQPGTLPDIDGSYEKKMGVCQDLSAITCCMLRVHGIPSRLVIGYADKNYHAWVVSDVDGKEVFFDPTAELSAISKVKDYTVERFY